MQWLKHSVRSLSFVEISFLSAYSYDVMVQLTIHWRTTTEPLNSWHFSLPLHSPQPRWQRAMKALSARSILPLLCFAFPVRERRTKGLLKYYWQFTVGEKSSFTAHLRMVLPSIAVNYRLASARSVIQGGPRLVSLSGQVLSTRPEMPEQNQKKKFCLLWWRNWEALLSSM